MEKNSGTDLIDSDHILGYFHFFSFTSNFYKRFCSLFLKLRMCVLCVCVYVQSVVYVQLFATTWTVAHQAPLSMEFFRQEYWSGLPFPTQMALPPSQVGQTYISCVSRTGRWILYHHTTWEALKLSMGTTISKIRWTQQYKYSYQPPDPSS